MQDYDAEAVSLIRKAEEDLAQVGPGPFSPQAFTLLKIRVAEHVRSLVTESAKISSRRNSDVISASHVSQASELLTSTSSRRIVRHIGTVGGILLGAAISNFLAMTTADQYTAVGVAVSAGLAAVGAFGVALHIGMD